MLSVEEVFRLIDTRVRALPACAVPLAEALGLVLAESLVADADQPANDHSAMDGYAVPEDALLGGFRLLGAVVPGIPAAKTPAAGEAIRVFTGSILPPGVKVVMQEDVVAEGEGIRVTTMERAGHVRRRGATAKKGEVLLKTGTELGPAQLGILASNGIVRPCVVARPRIAHLTTGSEVVPPETTPAEGQVRNSNAPLIRALAEQVGADVTAHRHCGEALEDAWAICHEQAFAESDLLIVSGGSSVGDHDHTTELLEKLGFELLVRKVAMRPGKPFLLGVREGRVAVGLPGNPLSHFVTFHLFVKRVLTRLSNLPSPTPASGTVHDPAKIFERGKLETWWPGVWRLRAGHLEISPLSWLHSGHLSALAGSNALLRVPPGGIPADGDQIEFLSYGEPVIHQP
jgi:molybdopterin molybdotransferase